MISRRDVLAGVGGAVACSAIPACGAPAVLVAPVATGIVTQFGRRFLQQAIKIGISWLLHNGFDEIQALINEHGGTSGTAIPVHEVAYRTSDSEATFKARLDEGGGAPIVVLALQNHVRLDLAPRAAQALMGVYQGLTSGAVLGTPLAEADALGLLLPTAPPSRRTLSGGIGFETAAAEIELAFDPGMGCEIVRVISKDDQIRKKWHLAVDRHDPWWLQGLVEKTAR